MRFVLIHHIPGRARLRTSEVFGHETSIGLADGLEVLPGVEGVRVNPRTGSVLLLYQTEDALSRACAFLTGFEILPEPEKRPVPAPKEKDNKPSLFPFFRYAFIRPLLPIPLRIFSAFTGAFPFLKRCVSSLAHCRLDVEALDGAAIAVSLLRRDFGTVSLLTLLLGFGDELERYTQKKSLENLASHLALKVDKIWVRRNGI